MFYLTPWLNTQKLQLAKVLFALAIRMSIVYEVNQKHDYSVPLEKNVDLLPKICIVFILFQEITPHKIQMF